MRGFVLLLLLLVLALSGCATPLGAPDASPAPTAPVARPQFYEFYSPL